METDPETNEGLLYVSKVSQIWSFYKCYYYHKYRNSDSLTFSSSQPLNHELGDKINLEIQARNEAELVNTNAAWNSIPVVVTVTNVDEGPEFSAPTVRFVVKENTKNGTLIGSYTATDPETKSSNGIT